MRLLFVGFDPGRKDLLNEVSGIYNKHDCLFLESFSRKIDTTPDNKIVYWSDYEDAFILLESIKPAKVIFILLDNYYHFALFFALRKLGIQSVYKDHGIRYANEHENLDNLEKARERYSINRFVRNIPLIEYFTYRKNRFYRKTLQKLDASTAMLARDLFRERFRSRYSLFMQKHGVHFIPDKFVIYSAETKKFYSKFFNHHNQASYTYTGIPIGDQYAGLINTNFTAPGFLLIDQPMHEQHLMGWTMNLKIEFINRLSSLLVSKGIKLYIKPHPWNDEYYKQINKEKLILVNDLTSEFVLNNVRFVASFNSTLLLPFCAIPGLVTLCLEMHPKKEKIPFSYDITKFETAEEVLDFDKLEDVINSPLQFLEKKKPHIQNYVEAMLYKFDGKSLDRIEAAILND